MSAGRVALVTGAGGSIGRATSVTLAQRGWRVMLVGRTERTLQETQRALEAGGGAAHIKAADIGDEAQARSVIDDAMRVFGRIDALINNAAIVMSRPIEQTDRALLLETFQTNLFGPMYLTAAIWPTFLHQRGGCVVNVSSLSSRDPFPGLTAYAASKSALESLARSIVVEGGPHNIQAYNLVVGAVETPMLRGLVPEEMLPRSMTLDPKDVARVIVECAKGKRASENGKNIVVVR